MHVLHINVNYIVSNLHQTMIEHLNQLDVDSKVFVPAYDRDRSIVDCKDYVTISECFNKWDRVLYFKKQRKIISSIQKTYDISQFDLIHAYTLFTDGNVAMELSKKYGIPYVVAIRNTDLNDFFKYMIHLRSHGVEILKRSSAIIFLSPVYRDIIIDKYVPEDSKEEIMSKSFVIPNGIDDYWHDNIQNKDLEESLERIHTNQTIKCIYVGNIDKNKNVESSLMALELLNHEGWDCDLTAVGKIVDKSVFDKLSNYTFFKYIEPKPKEDLIEFYRKSDIFLMPSYTETFGLVYAEAMTQGLPVIYSKGQGFDKQFPEGQVGFHVDAKSPESISKGIKKVLNDYCEISYRTSHLVYKFQWSSIVQQYESIYNSCIKE